MRPESYDVKYFDNFSQLLDELESFGDKPALSWFDEDKNKLSRTYREFAADVNGLRNKLVDAGLSGSHIAVLGENSYEWIVAFYAITASGGVAVLIDTEQTDDTIRELITRADATHVFASEYLSDICTPLLKTQKIQQVFLLDKNRSKPGAGTIYGMIREGASIPGKKTVEIDPEQMAAIVSTSGTTSKQKLVMLSQKNLLVNASDANANCAIGPVIFSSLPLYHTFGLTAAVLACMASGYEIVINGELRTLARDMMASGATTILAVPLIAEAMTKIFYAGINDREKVEKLKKVIHANPVIHYFGMKKVKPKLMLLKSHVFPNVKYVICGGAHLDLEVAQILAAFDIQVLPGYGTSECAPMISVTHTKNIAVDSVGTIVAHAKVRIVEDEIWVKGDNVMLGYYKDQEANDEVFEDGWYKTGDLGRVGKDDLLYFTGRKKNLIVLKNGKKISPEKIEELVAKIPLVKDVVAYGAASGSYADDVKPAVMIYPDPEMAKDMSNFEILSEINREIEKINMKLPLYQQIQGVTLREKEFEKTSTKKIKRDKI
jgi:long-chain acyl-CoA synthetase